MEHMSFCVNVCTGWPHVLEKSLKRSIHPGPGKSLKQNKALKVSECGEKGFRKCFEF